MLMVYFSIQHCHQSSDKCPLCKKKFTRRQIVSPLYFSTSDDNEDQITNSNDLQIRADTLANENRRSTQIIADLKRELINVKKVKEESEFQLNRVTKSMRYLKQIRR
jgi:hypothetical protein